MNHVLVTTDFSEGSQHAFAHAVDYVESHGKDSTKCTLLHVLDGVTSGAQFKLAAAVIESHGIDSELEAEAKKKLTEIKDKHFPGIDVEILVLTGKRKNVHEPLLEWAEKNGVTRIVAATHGRTGVSHAILGSVTETLIRNSPIPVLVIPVPKEDK
jgi:nucleotide-binding universal stress UspA family protein